MENAITNKIRLDEYELSIENEILDFEHLSQKEKIIDKENEKKHKSPFEEIWAKQEGQIMRMSAADALKCQ